MQKLKIFHFIPNSVGLKKFILPCYANSRKYKYPCTIIYSNIYSEKKNLKKKTKLNFLRINNFKLGPNIFITLVAFFEILKLIINLRPKLVVAHFTLGATLPLMSAKLLCVKHRIYFNHGVSYQSYYGFIGLCLRMIEKINIWLSTEVLTVSKRCQKKLKKLSTNKPVKLINHGSAAGLKLPKYSFKKLSKIKTIAKATLGYKPTDIVIMYVGRDVARKGIFEVKNIIDQLKEKKFRFIIAGIQNKEFIKKLKNKKVKFIKFQNKLDNFYFASDFVILPSKHEGFGYSLAEGAVNGCIPLASNVDGPKDIIINGHSGYLIGLNNTHKYVKYINLFSANRSLMKFFSYNAFRSIQKYDQNIFLKYYHKYFGEFLNK